MSAKETAIVVCPGRGTYNAAELGYLAQHHADKNEFRALVDAVRRVKGQVTVSELDSAEKFRMGLHGTGENASLLIFACVIADFMDLREHYDILAVTGNSMGWYLALACAGAVSLEDGARLVNEMGALMHEKGVGGQIVYPIVDDEWHRDPSREQLINDVLTESQARDDVSVTISIHLGGLIVLAACEPGLKFLAERLPETDRYPMRLNNHAAFHSALLNHIVPEAQSRLPREMFNKPQIPMVDGLGNVWSPYSTDTQGLYDYTLGTQINQTYNFSKAVEVAVKEFAPEKVIVTGPGTTMGAPVAQELIQHRWHGLTSKTDFKALQVKAPYIISMGLADQRALALGT